RGVIPLTDGDEALAAAARELSSVVLSAPVESIAGRLDHLITRMEWTGEEHRAIRQALLTLLRLIIDNIRELVIDDSWLHGQLSIISAAFDGVLDIRLLDEVEHRLRDVIEKQSHLKRQLSDAQQRLKSMLAGFIDRLSDFSAVTGDYQEVLGQGAQRISKAQNIEELSDVVEEILRETHNTRESTKRSGEELSRLREEVDSANQHILRLQRELDETSELVRHDPLTGALNRKGLDEALAREISRMRRLGTALCIGLLDIDNFKQINDAHGHLVGDDALRHLSAIVRETLRPQDAVARYGGEEFLILLPDTELDQANAILVRLQRELTRRFFLANTEHLLITFSAGISRLSHDEDPMIAIDRADKAMYAAKRAGKNRVLNAA
ncbi:MAG: GGDEF domain-containing protein, partial [Betaproteobacteria bacterium HGW-Betaproteobacteria-19]